MKLEELMGKYMRLRAELAAAYEAGSRNTDHLNRLGDEIASTERALARAQPRDERTSDLLPGLHL
jgi:hypothetical protein